MTSEELAERVAATIAGCQERIRSTGAQQYGMADGSQMFEHMNLVELLTESRDEVRDHINYGVMIDIRLSAFIEEIAALQLMLAEDAALIEADTGA